MDTRVMRNTYLISYEEKAGGVRRIGDDVQLGPGAVGCTFVLDLKSIYWYWKKTEKALKAATREEALVEYEAWENKNKNSMEDNKWCWIRNAKLIEQSVIAE